MNNLSKQSILYDIIMRSTVSVRAVLKVVRWGLDDATDSVSRLLSLLCGTVGSELASGSYGPWFESRKTHCSL